MTKIHAVEINFSTIKEKGKGEREKGTSLNRSPREEARKKFVSAAQGGETSGRNNNRAENATGSIEGLLWQLPGN